MPAPRHSGRPAQVDWRRLGYLSVLATIVTTVWAGLVRLAL